MAEHQHNNVTSDQISKNVVEKPVYTDKKQGVVEPTHEEGVGVDLVEPEESFVDKLSEALQVSEEYLRALVGIVSLKEVVAEVENSQTIELGYDFEDFTEEKKQGLIDDIAKQVGVDKDEIRITEIELGSFHLTLIIGDFKLILAKGAHTGIVDVYKPRNKSNSQKRTILFLAANPSDSARIRNGEEFRRSATKLCLRDKYKLVKRLGVRVEDLTYAMLRHKPKIVHFSGHGTPDGLCFENEDGESYIPPIEAIAKLFQGYSDYTECVVLLACYTDKQAEAIAKHIHYVIGMRNEIIDDFAIKFSTGFYQALAEEGNIEEAYRGGLDLMSLSGYKGKNPSFYIEGTLQDLG